jgi:hypothetical protein
LAQTELFGLSTTPISSWTHFVLRSAISTSGLNVVNVKSASTTNEKSTSIQAESSIFCETGAQSAGLRLNA